MTDQPNTVANVVPLSFSQAFNMSLTPDGFFSSIVQHIKDRELIDLDGDWINDVELIAPQPGERKLGPLTLFETHMFALAMLAQEIIQDVMIEAQAQTAEAAARLLRQQKSHSNGTEMNATVTVSEEDRIYLNELSCIFHITRAAYEFSARTRFENFDKYLIVRSGYVAYSVDG